MLKRLLLLYTDRIKRIYKKILIFEYILKENKYNKKNLFKFKYKIIYNNILIMYDGKRVKKPPWNNIWIIILYMYSSWSLNPRCS